MLQPPLIRARQRFFRRYGGPMLAALIIGAGAYYFLLGPAPAQPAQAQLVGRPLSQPAAYANCTAARAAGAAPVYRGEAGYGPHLDADSDGIGCEPYRGR